MSRWLPICRSGWVGRGCERLVAPGEQKVRSSPHQRQAVTLVEVHRKEAPELLVPEDVRR